MTGSHEWLYLLSLLRRHLVQFGRRFLGLFDERPGLLLCHLGGRQSPGLLVGGNAFSQTLRRLLDGLLVANIVPGRVVPLGGRRHGQKATGRTLGSPQFHDFGRDLELAVPGQSHVVILVLIHQQAKLNVTGMIRGVAAASAETVCCKNRRECKS